MSAGILALTAAAPQPRYATADLVYYCCDVDNSMTVFVETKPNERHLLDPCEAHLWLVPVGGTPGVERELTLDEHAGCGVGAAKHAEESLEPRQLRLHATDLYRDPGAFRVELRTDRDFVETLEGTPIPVAGPSFPHLVQIYAPRIAADAPHQPFVDDEAAALMRRFGHRPLWAYGDRLFWCGDKKYGGTVTIRDHTPVEITAVERVPDVDVELPLGTHFPSFCGGYCHELDGYMYVAHAPLRVRFAFARGGFRQTPRGGISGVFAPPAIKRCTTSSAYVADDWAFERLFTTTDPRIAHPGWDPSLVTQMLAFKAAPGMTPEMVAFALGFPSAFGAAQQLMQATRWNWYPGTDLDTTATFKDGVLQSIAPLDEFYFMTAAY
jgi:hypothetical protein